MGYATSARTRRIPGGPRFRGRLAQTAGPAGQTLGQLLGPWSFTAVVYLSWDSATAANPQWFDVTEFVDLTAGIQIGRGRSDGFSDVSAGTLALTVNNNDGRWTEGNAAGAWAGQIRKGAWIRVDLIPLSGTVSTRYVGFITALPIAWTGLQASTALTASDRFLYLGQARKLQTMISSEVLTDTSTGPYVAAYYPLTEASGSTSAGDISGNVSPPLVPTPWGPQATGTTGLKFAGDSGPGFDGIQSVTFAPTSISSGSALVTTVANWNNWNTQNPVQSYGILSLWLNTSLQGTTNPFACVYDPVNAQAIVFAVDATGYLSINLVATSTASAFGSFTLALLTPGATWQGAPVEVPKYLADGEWHFLSIAVDNAAAYGGTFATVNIDGIGIWFGASGTGSAPDMTTLVIGGGWQTGATQQSCFTGSVSNVAWTRAAKASNYLAQYLAGATGFYGESVDQRIARLARYTGIPQPTVLQPPAPTYTDVPIYVPGSYGPWTDLNQCVHQVGTQAIVGRQPLDVMLEAARSENMPLLINRPGYLAIQPCTTRYNASAAWTVDARDLDPATTVADDYQYFANQIQITPNGQATIVVDDQSGSENLNGVYSQSLATASLNPADATNLALAVIAAGANPPPRLNPVVEVASLATQAGYGAAWYDEVLASDVNSVMTITNLPAQAPSPSMNLVIEGYTETIGAGTHTFAWSVSQQTNTAVYQCDSPTLGVVDTPGITLAY